MMLNSVYSRAGIQFQFMKVLCIYVDSIDCDLIIN